MAGTIIGSSIVINGELSAEEDLVVHGTVKGKIAVKESLLIERMAVVEADIEGASVVVAGQLQGNLIANERVELKSEGRMVGSIRSPRIHMAEGAVFKGSVDMEVK